MAGVKRADEMEERLFVRDLHRTRDVAMSLLDRVGRLAWLPEQLLKPRREQRANVWAATLPLIRNLILVVAEVRRIEREGALFFEQDDLAHLVDVFGFAVRGEAHHLVLIAVVGEA